MCAAYSFFVTIFDIFDIKGKGLLSFGHKFVGLSRFFLVY